MADTEPTVADPTVAEPTVAGKTDAADASSRAGAPSAVPSRATPLMLAGIRILDLGGIGPGPYAGMLLADLGAELVRIDRPAEAGTPANPVLDRGKRSIALDLKSPAAPEAVARLAANAHAVIEGFRPGVAERLGVGPAELLAANPRLVYGRVTGWGQTGPAAAQPGHDLNYIAAGGVLSKLGRAGEAPMFPANLLGDFGGGGMQLALGLVAGILRAERTGAGTVVSAAMLDGANHLWSMMFGYEVTGMWNGGRGENLLDSGAPFYDVYPTADGAHAALGCIEPQFFAAFVTCLGLADRLPAPLGSFDHWNPQYWPALRELFAHAIAEHTAAELEEIVAGTEACVSIVASMDEAEASAHNAARAFLYRDTEGIRQPAPIPRFAAPGTQPWAGAEAGSPAIRHAASVDANHPAPDANRSAPDSGHPAPDANRSAPDSGDPAAEVGEPYVRPGPAPRAGQHTNAVLTEWGFSAADIAALREAGAIS